MPNLSESLTITPPLLLHPRVDPTSGCTSASDSFILDGMPVYMHILNVSNCVRIQAA